MKRILKYIENMPWWIKNIYFLISFSFIVWMVFFDRNNSFATYKINKSLKTLENQREYYRTEIEKVNDLKEELFPNIFLHSIRNIKLDLRINLQELLQMFQIMVLYLQNIQKN